MPSQWGWFFPSSHPDGSWGGGDAPLQIPKVRTCRNSRLSREFDDHFNHVRQVPDTQPEQPSTEEQEEGEKKKKKTPLIIVIAVEPSLAASTLHQELSSKGFWLPLSQRAPPSTTDYFHSPIQRPGLSARERLGARQVGYDPNARPGVTVQHGENRAHLHLQLFGWGHLHSNCKDTSRIHTSPPQPKLKKRGPKVSLRHLQKSSWC